MHYRLRTLLIVLALGPPVLAASWPKIERWLNPPLKIKDLEGLRSLPRPLCPTTGPESPYKELFDVDQ
jgi:hypothetical protein